MHLTPGAMPLMMNVHQDNAPNNCKNSKTFKWAAMLCLLQVFRWPLLSYLRKGHTREDLDQCHGQVCANIAITNLDLPDRLGPFMTKSFCLNNFFFCSHNHSFQRGYSLNVQITSSRGVCFRRLLRAAISAFSSCSSLARTALMLQSARRVHLANSVLAVSGEILLALSAHIHSNQTQRM